MGTRALKLRSLCHPGPCPPCQVALIVPCPSHHTPLTVKCAAATSNNAALSPVCDEICDRERDCGNREHACEVRPFVSCAQFADHRFTSNFATTDPVRLVIRSRLSSVIAAAKAKRSTVAGIGKTRSSVRRSTRRERRNTGLDVTHASNLASNSTIADSTLVRR